MIWTKSKVKSHYVIKCDGQELTTMEAARKLDISIGTLRGVCNRTKNDEEFNKKLEGITWLKQNGFSHKETVYYKGDEKVCISLICQTAGVVKSTAWNRIKRWQADEIQMDLLLEDAEITRKRTAKIAIANMQRANSFRQCWGDLGLEPRKQLSDLQRPGTWEREQSEEAVFSQSDSGHQVCHNTAGVTYYRGD